MGVGSNQEKSKQIKMKSKLFFLFVVLTQFLYAQTFTETPSTLPFDGAWGSSIAFTDVNGDSSDDALITGLNNSGEKIAKLYIKDGTVSATDDLTIGIIPDIVLFPYPSTPYTLYLSYNATEIGDVTISVYCIEGVLLKQQSPYTTLGQQTLSIDIASLIQGNYFINCMTVKPEVLLRLSFNRKRQPPTFHTHSRKQKQATVGTR